MPKNITFVLVFVISSLAIYSQDKRDIGIQLGGTYYYGDFNEVKPLSKPSLGLGVIFRYNFNNFYSLRLSALYGKVEGTYDNSRYLPSVWTSSFSKSYLDADIMGEFNFIKFTPLNTRNAQLSPFVNVGLGISQIGGAITPNIPFGLGVKFTSGQRHTVALEWRFHKTFTDKLDTYTAPNDGKSVALHNNDWVSFMGLIYTYRLFNNNDLCPVYK